ncbi:MAG TPA: GAF domain-containing SpoIIE family protein phosphatase [Candidatus Limnocylindria bacterium]|nr:GAF domain-containing SpoIIE family protein phosphatase [Candidatus Limnocylindria bacterium]
MTRAQTPLRRLVTSDLKQLLDAFTAATPGLGLAVVGNDGEVVHASGDWPAGVPPDATGSSAGSLVLEPRGEPLGRLVSSGSAPAALVDGLGLSMALLLRERLDKHDLARETLERYREINLLYRASETIGASLNPAAVPQLLLDEAERVIPSDAAAFLIGDTPAGAGWERAAQLIDEVLATGRPDIAAWPTADDDMLASALCVPAHAGEKVLGAVILGRSGNRPMFTAGDEKLLLGLASQAGIALERAWLHERETRRLQLEEELAVAHRIQLTLLPSATPVVPGWDFAATYRAARQVGGDFYDFLDHRLAEGRFGLVIADVTGKGVPAALMMAYTRAVLRAESMAGHSVVRVLENTNRLMVQERQSRPFLSALYAEIELDSGRLEFASAGHDAPLWVAAGGRATRLLEAPGVILGAFQRTGLEARSLTLDPGDVVVFYTDGVTEARDVDRQLFGDERLEQAAVAAVAAGGSAESVLESLISAVADFTAGAEQSDDLTIVVARREGG